MNETQLLERIRSAYLSILGNKLTGIYVHGSIAFGCFRWDTSDIDFLVVVNQSLTMHEKEELIRILLNLDNLAPPKGFEMSVVTESVCNPFLYPTPFELHFSNAHKARCQKDLTEYCRTMSGTDPDLAAHVTVLRHVGYALCGKPVSKVFAEVPRENYLDSIRGDIQDAEQDIVDQPVYYILNLCRVLACAEKGLILSKEQGGIWGSERVGPYAKLIRFALESYLKGTAFTASSADLRNFAVFMLHRIQKYT